MTPPRRLAPDADAISTARAASDAQLAFLRTARAQDALALLADTDLSDDAILAQATALRRTFAPEEAAALLTQARLRRRAAAKFPAADRMLFAEEPLEQATAWEVARQRAARLNALAPPGDFLDLGCGIGGDLLALAQHRPTAAFEIDPVRLALAAHNVENVPPHFPVSFHAADWTVALKSGSLPPAGAAFADPARRTAQGKRIFSLHAMQPPLAALLNLQARVPALAVKVAPGVRDAEVPAACSVEFVSHAGVCKEAVLWFGPLVGNAQRWASVHDGAAWHMLVSHGATPPLGGFDAGDWLYEPDPAVLRAGAFAELCERLDAHLFDPEIGYLLAAARHATPFARAFRLLERHPFSLKLLNARLAALGVGTLEIKKRGFPIEPESLRPRLRLTPGGRAAVVFLTRRGRDHWMLFAEREAF